MDYHMPYINYTQLIKFDFVFLEKQLKIIYYAHVNDAISKVEWFELDGTYFEITITIKALFMNVRWKIWIKKMSCEQSIYNIVYEKKKLSGHYY